MLRLIAFTIFGFVTTAVGAQTYFSFSGLQWSESLEQVELRLQNAGLPLTSKTEKLKCKVIKNCTMTFGGSTRGTVSMSEGKLAEVHVFAVGAPNAYADRLSRLQARYGEPKPRLSSPTGASKFELFDDVLVKKWEAPNGENLELTRDGAIFYRSSRNKDIDQGVKF